MLPSSYIGKRHSALEEPKSGDCRQGRFSPYRCREANLARSPSAQAVTHSEGKRVSQGKEEEAIQPWNRSGSGEEQARAILWGGLLLAWLLPRRQRLSQQPNRGTPVSTPAVAPIPVPPAAQSTMLGNTQKSRKTHPTHKRPTTGCSAPHPAVARFATHSPLATPNLPPGRCDPRGAGPGELPRRSRHSHTWSPGAGWP